MIKGNLTLLTINQHKIYKVLKIFINMGEQKSNAMLESESLMIKLNPKVYSLQIIYATAYSLLDKAYILLDGDPEKEILVQLFPKDEQDSEKLKQRFYDELINYGNYYSSLNRDKEIVKMILERALFSANPSLAEEAEEKEIQELLKELKEEDKVALEK